MTLRELAEQAAHSAIARMHGRAAEIMGPQAIIADAIERVAKEFAERALRDTMPGIIAAALRDHCCGAETPDHDKELR